MPSLVEFIRDCAEQREAVRIGPLLDGIAGTLQTIIGLEDDRLAAATEDDATLRRNRAEARAAAERMNERLAERRRRGTRISFLGNDVDQIVRRRVDGLKREYLEHIAAADLTTAARVDAYARTLPESLSRSLDALWQELLIAVEEVVAESLQEFAHSLDVAAVDVSLERSERQVIHPTDAPAVRGARFDTVGDGVPMITLTYSLAMIGAMVNPVGVVVGPALAVALMWRRQQNKTKAQGQADLRGFVTSVLNQARVELSAALAKQVSQKRTEVEIAVDAELTRQRKDIQARVDQANRLQNADVATRKQVAVEAGTRLKTLHGLRDALTGIRTALG